MSPTKTNTYLLNSLPCHPCVNKSVTGIPELLVWKLKIVFANVEHVQYIVVILSLLGNYGKIKCIYSTLYGKIGLNIMLEKEIKITVNRFLDSYKKYKKIYPFII